MDKYNRTNFYKSEVVDGIVEQDLLTNSTKVFDNTNDYLTYVIKEEDLFRPDLISQKIYGTHLYWWILLKANNIEDPWNDLSVGMILEVPPQSDIDKYYKANKKS